MVKVWNFVGLHQMDISPVTAHIRDEKFPSAPTQHLQRPSRGFVLFYLWGTLSSQNSCLTWSPKCGSLVFWKRWCLHGTDRHTIMGVLAGSCSGWVTDFHWWKMDLHNKLCITSSENPAMRRLTSCLVLTSASMENMTLKAALFLLTKLRFSILCLSSLFPSKVKFMSFLSDLCCCIVYSAVLHRYFNRCNVLFWLSHDEKSALVELRGSNLIPRKT